jgi:hypothetical protein
MSSRACGGARMMEAAVPAELTGPATAVIAAFTGPAISIINANAQNITYMGVDFFMFSPFSNLI